MIIRDRRLTFNEPLTPLREEDVNKIIIHHSSGKYLTAESVNDMHKKRFRWAGIGYNYYIEFDGTIVKGRGLNIGAHAARHNKNTIGIGISGNFDIEKPNILQIESLHWLCLNLMKKFNLTENDILGHRELPNVKKTCPGLLFDMDLLRKEMGVLMNGK